MSTNEELLTQFVRDLVIANDSTPSQRLRGLDLLLQVERQMVEHRLLCTPPTLKIGEKSNDGLVKIGVYGNKDLFVRPETYNSMFDELRKSNPIAAIRYLRGDSGLALKEAKDIVDAIRHTYAHYPQRID